MEFRGNIGASPGNIGLGKGAPTHRTYIVGCLTRPEQFVCGGGRRIATVAALRVACTSNLYRVSYDGSPSIFVKVEKVNAALMSSADGIFIVIVGDN